MDVVNNFLGAFAGGDWITIVLKIVLGLAIGVGVFFLFRWINNQEKEQAHTATMGGRATDQSGINDKTTLNDGQKSEADIEKLIQDKDKK